MNEILGVGPHPLPWPTDERYDPELLANGDIRNVIDSYRYWSVEAIKSDLDKTRFPFEVAIENFQHDFNIGTIVRNANAFNARAVHIIGRKHWNKRGAMVTDLYMNVYYHSTVADFAEAMAKSGKRIVGIDILPASLPLAATEIPVDSVMVFGGEGPGLSAKMQERCEMILNIEQFGSTRSINVGVASGIAMYSWVKAHQLTSTSTSDIMNI